MNKPNYSNIKLWLIWIKYYHKKIIGLSFTAILIPISTVNGFPLLLSLISNPYKSERKKIYSLILPLTISHFLLYYDGAKALVSAISELTLEVDNHSSFSWGSSEYFTFSINLIKFVANGGGTALPICVILSFTIPCHG